MPFIYTCIPGAPQQGFIANVGALSFAAVCSAVASAVADISPHVSNDWLPCKYAAVVMYRYLPQVYACVTAAAVGGVFFLCFSRRPMRPPTIWPTLRKK